MRKSKRKWRQRWLLMIIGIIATVDIFFISEIVRNRYYLIFDNDAEEVIESQVIDIADNDNEGTSAEENQSTIDDNIDITDNTTQEQPGEEEATEGEDTVEDEDITGGESEETKFVENARVKWIKDRKYSCEQDMMGMDSYEATMLINKKDKEIIAACTIDFSGMVLTAFGDSLTEGIGLSPHDQPKYNWEAQTKEILGFEDYYNFGRSGSTVYGKGKYFPMTERWEEIPKESDIIVVMGGTNDVMTGSAQNFGEINGKNRKRDTFCGDLDYLLRSIRETYCTEDHYCRLMYINPPGNPGDGTEEELKSGKKVSQDRYSEAIITIAKENGFDVIDFYNSNFVDPRDDRVEAELTTDGIHYNREGYRIIAEHMASEIIQRIYQGE